MPGQGEGMMDGGMKDNDNGEVEEMKKSHSHMEKPLFLFPHPKR